MISNKHRNWIQQIKTNKIANTRQTMQHKMIQIYKKIKLKMEHRIDKNDGINYNLKQFRQDPKKIHPKIDQYIDKIKPHEETWDKIQQNLNDILAIVYPLQKTKINQ